MRSPRTTRPVAFAVVVVSASLVVGCTSDDPGPRPTESTTSAQIAEPSPTSASPAPDEQARSALSTAITDYYTLQSLLATDPSTDLNRVYEVANDSAAQRMIDATISYRDDGVMIRGTIIAAGELVQQLELSGAQGSPSTAQVQVCVDVSGVDAVDGSGQSVVSPDRQPRAYETLVLRSNDGTPEGPWFVTDVSAQGTAC